MQLITLIAAREDPGLLTVTGVCGDSTKFLYYLNTAIQRLLIRGDWFGTLFRVEVCVHDNCVVWPRQVGKIRALKICKESALVQNQWFSFMPYQPGQCCARELATSDYVAEQRGLSPVFRQIPCGAANWYVRLYIERQADIGKTCTIYGEDTNGQILRSIKADGIYSEGVTIVATVPYISTAIPIRRVTRVFFNEPFAGNARLYGYDADADVLHDIGLYEPGETEPAYVYSRILGGNRTRLSGTSGCCCKSLEALAKINPDPLRIDTDLLQIQNLEAVKMAIQSVRKEEAGDMVTSRERMNAAVAEMNRWDEDWQPTDQIPINIYPFGGARLSYHGIGRFT